MFLLILFHSMWCNVLQGVAYLLVLSLFNTAKRYTSFFFWQHDSSNEQIMTNTERARMEVQEIKKVISQEKRKLKVNEQRVFSFITYLELECIET